MTKILFTAVILIWHRVVFCQLSVNNFCAYSPYYDPYTSTFVLQPNTQIIGGTKAQLGGTGELGHHPNIKTFSFQDTITFKINQLQATIASLASQLRATNANLATKAAQKDLDTTNTDVSNLVEALQTTNTNLATKAAQTDLDKTNDDVSDLIVITSPKSIGSVPTSCGDLQTIGFVKSGIYSVMVNNKVQNVYCDFTASNNADLQTIIGIVDVKSTAVYFHAQLTSTYSSVNTGVVFGSIKLNLGNALNPETGVFVAPTPGKYYFAYSGISDNGVDVRVLLQVKTASTDWTGIGEGYGDTSYKTFSFHGTLQLLKDDQVRLFLTEGRIHESDTHIYTNYVGWLIEEN